MFLKAVADSAPPLSNHSMFLIDLSRNKSFFFIINLVTKAPGFNIAKKLSNLLCNHEFLNSSQHFVCFSLPKETRIAMQFNDFCLYYRKIVVKNK